MCTWLSDMVQIDKILLRYSKNMQPVICLTSDCLRMFDKIDYIQKVETILKKSHAMFR